ncbi:MAG: GNAT family N-acetyltransferase [Saprospiraceae bacterium]
MFLLPLTIHQASPQDQDWINEQYKSIDFRLADLQQDYVAIASWEKEPAGLGRLQPLDSNAWELGGMYVFESFRKKGIAGRLVQHLLAQVPAGSTIYCLPFEPLLSFYKNYGFQETKPEQVDKVPEVVRSKLDWCNTSRYPDPVLLLEQHK